MQLQNMGNTKFITLAAITHIFFIFFKKYQPNKRN